jgi:hypothetical protein
MHSQDAYPKIMTMSFVFYMKIVKREWLWTEKQRLIDDSRSREDSLWKGGSYTWQFYSYPQK